MFPTNHPFRVLTQSKPKTHSVIYYNGLVSTLSQTVPPSPIDLSKEMPWRSIKGDFIDVGVYCLPALSSFAPRGLCPQAHTNDGILELVLVRATNRREFIRFLRRQLNTKNQVGPVDTSFGTLTGGPQCRKSILRNGNIPCCYFYNFHIDLEIV